MIPADLGPWCQSPSLREEVDLERIGAYRGLGEVFTEVLEIAGEHTSIAGRTCEGLPLVRVDLPGEESDGPVALVIGGIHAMEFIGVEVALALLRQLVRERGRRRVVLFPLLNPEGYLRAETDLRAGRRRFVRSNSVGVDLNRNWPTHWRTTRLPQRILTFLGSAGSAPLSEPEVAMVVEAMAPVAAERRLERALSLHSFGNKLLVPYGGRWRRPLGSDAHDGHALEVRARLRDRYHLTTPARWVPGLFAYGMELDHFHAWGADPLLVECSSGGLSLTDPASWLHPFRWFNPPDPTRQAAELAVALVPFLQG
ncbi:MAG: succinylglutamate desuccinylase/aspartoacylase family protein [Alphaproteobacteria bacterium]|nr:succinylglutamate desuccinylase/aspartoacylase family protein [Alphaproteobacteria bacterium]MCB9696812.1 succinylglutamate desuccinylase/aspartoacylase family protein [Alphaproteobacteria bacterium]